MGNGSSRGGGRLDQEGQGWYDGDQDETAGGLIEDQAVPFIYATSPIISIVCPQFSRVSDRQHRQKG